MMNSIINVRLLFDRKIYTRVTRFFVPAEHPLCSLLIPLLFAHSSGTVYEILDNVPLEREQTSNPKFYKDGSPRRLACNISKVLRTANFLFRISPTRIIIGSTVATTIRILREGHSLLIALPATILTNRISYHTTIERAT